MFVTPYPRMLLGHAESEPDEIRRKSVNFLNHVFLSIPFERAIQMTFTMKRANEFDAGIQSSKKLSQLRATFFRPAKQIVRKLLRHRLQELAHERGAINPVVETCACGIQTPDQRHSIRRETVKWARQFAKAEVMPAHRDDLGIRKIHCHTTAISCPVMALPGKTGIICYQHRSAQQID